MKQNFFLFLQNKMSVERQEQGPSALYLEAYEKFADPATGLFRIPDDPEEAKSLEETTAFTKFYRQGLDAHNLQVDFAGLPDKIQKIEDAIVALLNIHHQFTFEGDYQYVETSLEACKTFFENFEGDLNSAEAKGILAQNLKEIQNGIQLISGGDAGYSEPGYIDALRELETEMINALGDGS